MNTAYSNEKAYIAYRINEGYIDLACAIGKIRAKDFRKAYRKYLKNPSRNNLIDVQYQEQKLKKFPTMLEDDHIVMLKKQVRIKLGM